MDPLVKIMGAIDIIAAAIIIMNFPSIWTQIIGWALVIKGAISLLS
jgi:uncharacterized membrane protein HdeD (DUF308 family)